MRGVASLDRESAGLDPRAMPDQSGGEETRRKRERTCGRRQGIGPRRRDAASRKKGFFEDRRPTKKQKAHQNPKSRGFRPTLPCAGGHFHRRTPSVPVTPAMVRFFRQLARPLKCVRVADLPETRALPARHPPLECARNPTNLTTSPVPPCSLPATDAPRRKAPLPSSTPRPSRPSPRARRTWRFGTTTPTPPRPISRPRGGKPR